MEWSLSKLIRIESGSVGISTTDLRALLQHYGIVDPTEVERILDLARAGKEQRGWWTAYRDVASPQYQALLGYEGSASVIQTFQPLLIPGLLQNADYARAVLRPYYGEASADNRLEELVELRVRRQEKLFERPDPPEMFVVIDEAALRRWVGGDEVMNNQLLRLKEENQRPNVTIEVVPFSAGIHPGIHGGPFLILQFTDERDQDVLFLENSRGDIVTRDDEDEIERYSEAFVGLRELAGKEELDRAIERAQGKSS